jgi:hypothetical protein
VRGGDRAGRDEATLRGFGAAGERAGEAVSVSGACGEVTLRSASASGYQATKELFETIWSIR